jgi:BASS family bile acid:Na+ symporter
LVYVVAVTLMSIAFGMGLGLEIKDFTRLASAPKPILVGLSGQILLLPVVATLLASFVSVPALAVGLLLIGVCPGGSSSNYFSFLARGNVALSISLTALTGILSVLYLPFAFNFAAELVLGAGVVRKLKRDWAIAWRSRVATIGFIALILTTVLLVRDYIGHLDGIVATVAIWVTALFLIMIPCGYGLAKITGLVEADRRSITVEIGVQNIALAMYLAVTFFDDPSYLIIPMGYLLLMWVFVPGFIAACRYADRRQG